MGHKASPIWNGCAAKMAPGRPPTQRCWNSSSETRFRPCSQPRVKNESPCILYFFSDRTPHSVEIAVGIPPWLQHTHGFVSDLITFSEGTDFSVSEDMERLWRWFLTILSNVGISDMNTDCPLPWNFMNFWCLLQSTAVCYSIITLYLNC